MSKREPLEKQKGQCKVKDFLKEQKVSVMQVTSRGAKGSLNSLIMSVNILNIYMNRKFRNFQEEQKGLNILGLEFFVRELKRNRKV